MINTNLSEIFRSPTELTRDQLSFAEATTKSLQKWGNTLSMMQLGDTSKHLLTAVIELSELKCSETLRFDLIQTLHPFMENILKSLEVHFFNQNLISPDRNEYLIELALSFRCYFTNIYLDIVRRSHHQLNHQKFSLFALSQKKNLKTARLLASYYALQQLAKLLYQQQMLYSAPLPHQWLIAHQVYDITLKHDEQFTDINQIQGTQYTVSNVNQAYTQLLLLDIFTPHQIRPSEIQALYQCSFDWAKMIQVLPRETTLAKYIVDVSKDYPPVYNKKQLVGFEPTFFISTQNLLEHINATFHKNMEYLSKNETVYLTSAIKFHVQNVLGSTVERQYERYEYSAQIQLCFSLTTAHFYLSNGKNFQETLQLSNHFKFQSESKSTQSNFSNENKIINENNDVSSSALLEREAKHVYTAQVLDISINGYRIRWDKITPSYLRTGEFILINESTQKRWRGGVVRWIKQNEEKTLDAGLEIIAYDIYPCAVKTQTDKNSFNYHPAFLVQNQNLDDLKTSLILPSLQLFKEQQSVHLRVGNEDIKVYLLKTLSITQSFVQFDYELLNDQQQPMIDDFINFHANELNTHDLWDALK